MTKKKSQKKNLKSKQSETLGKPTAENLEQEDLESPRNQDETPTEKSTNEDVGATSRVKFVVVQGEDPTQKREEDSDTESELGQDEENKWKADEEVQIQQFHNANFQPNLYEVVVNFSVVVTSPVYPICCASIALCSAGLAYCFGSSQPPSSQSTDPGAEPGIKRSSTTELREKLKKKWSLSLKPSEYLWMFWHDQYMWRALLNPLNGASILVNIALLLWFFAGRDGKEVYPAEIWLPRWVVVGLTLLLATQWDLAPSLHAYEVKADKEDEEQQLIKRGTQASDQSDDTKTKETQSFLQSPKQENTQNQKSSQKGYFSKSLRPIQDGFREYIDCAGRTEWIRDVDDADIDFSRIRNLRSELVASYKPDKAIKRKMKQQLKPFQSTYKKHYKKELVPLWVLARQMKNGWPVTHTGPMYYIGIGIQLCEICVGVLLFLLCALIPGFLREVRKDQGGHFLPNNGFAQGVALLFMGFMILDWILTCALPVLLRKLFSRMAKSFRLLNAMLMGEHAAREECIPHVRVGCRDDIAAWYELYILLISCAQKRKFPLEVAFAHNTVTVVGMSLFLVAYALDNDWQPAVLFFQTTLHLIAFFIFSLPPLVVGLRVNTLGRRTVDLLWGHAAESRAYLCRLEKQLEDRSDAEEIAELQHKIKEAKAAIDLTVDIAQRLRLDTALVVKTLGMELTVTRFTAIASIASSALIATFRNRHLFEGKLNAFVPLATAATNALNETVGYMDRPPRGPPK